MSAGSAPLGGSSDTFPKKNADQALDLMERALGLIDASHGPKDAGAHLDLAIHRLKAWIEDSQSK